VTWTNRVSSFVREAAFVIDLPTAFNATAVHVFFYKIFTKITMLLEHPIEWYVASYVSIPIRMKLAVTARKLTVKIIAQLGLLEVS
jgi:hypothetical protein